MAGKLVAVCGATGQQGGAVVDALLGLGGFKVRGLTRDPSSPSSLKLASKGVEVRSSGWHLVAGLGCGNAYFSEHNPRAVLLSACVMLRAQLFPTSPELSCRL